MFFDSFVAHAKETVMFLTAPPSFGKLSWSTDYPKDAISECTLIFPAQAYYPKTMLASVVGKPL